VEENCQNHQEKTVSQIFILRNFISKSQNWKAEYTSEDILSIEISLIAFLRGGLSEFD
jgi:hypothetical protein